MGRKQGIWTQHSGLRTAAFSANDPQWQQALQKPAAGRMDGLMKGYAYDLTGELRGVQHSLHGKTQNRYDATGRMHAIDHADGSREQFAYDTANRLIGYRDPLGQETHYTLNLHGLPIARKDALGHTLGYRYDSVDRLVELANENQAVAGFKYDNCDRLIEETGFDGRVQRYEYNAAGELIQKIDGAASAPLPLRTTYERDKLGRLARKITPSGETRYRYDELGQLESAINDAARLTWQYDPLGRVLHETSLVKGIEATLKHAYDPLGNRTSLTLPDGRVINYLYFGIDMNDAANGIWLPETVGDRRAGDTMTAHKGEGVHGKAYKQHVHDTLKDATDEADFRNKLKRLNDELGNGKTFPLACPCPTIRRRP